MNTPNGNTTFYLELLEFLFSAKSQLVSIGATFNLTSIQVVTLLLIDEAQPRPMKNFCNLYNCDASNVTGIIDGLERKGLVTRQNDPTDRRLKIICLEPAGRTVQADIFHTLESSSSFLFAPLDSSEKIAFRNIIKKLAASTLPVDQN